MQQPHLSPCRDVDAVGARNAASRGFETAAIQPPSQCSPAPTVLEAQPGAAVTDMRDFNPMLAYAGWDRDEWFALEDLCEALGMHPSDYFAMSPDTRLRWAALQQPHLSHCREADAVGARNAASRGFETAAIQPPLQCSPAPTVFEAQPGGAVTDVRNFNPMLAYAGWDRDEWFALEDMCEALGMHPSDYFAMSPDTRSIFELHARHVSPE